MRKFGARRQGKKFTRARGQGVRNFVEQNNPRPPWRVKTNSITRAIPRENNVLKSRLSLPRAGGGESRFKRTLCVIELGRAQEVAEQLFAGTGQDRLRVELHALDRKLAVA